MQIYIPTRIHLSGNDCVKEICQHSLHNVEQDKAVAVRCVYTVAILRYISEYKRKKTPGNPWRFSILWAHIFNGAEVLVPMTKIPVCEV